MNTFGSPWPSPPRLENISDDGIPMDSLGELQDSNFEPQTRARSNTWPLPRPENFIDPSEDPGSTKASTHQLSTGGQAAASLLSSTPNAKKNSSRRNAWGNLSYADLITQAISSATDSRLTLSQIYEWMVQNVPYFKDKGDSNSSAGWKNSIRHNLSLHNRFMRVQNEGTGKSSWWMLNPDARPGKSVRRRAASMETSKFEKRRGRAKKRVEALRNAQALGLASASNINDTTPSPSSSVSEGLDHFPDSPLHSGSFQLSPDFRQRASSNASSVGRLSPIPSILRVESDWPFTSNLTDFSTEGSSSNLAPTSQEQAVLDQLAGSIADELTFQNEFLQGFTVTGQMHNQPPPPPYQAPQPYSLHATMAQSYGMQLILQNSTRELQTMSPASGTDMSPSYPHSEPSCDYTMLTGACSLQPAPTEGSTISTSNLQNIAELCDSNTPQTLMGQFMEALNPQTNLDDLNINLEPFQGGLDCNVDEVIKHELSVDGSLDFNFPVAQGQHLLNQQALSNNLNSDCQNTTNVEESSLQIGNNSIHDAVTDQSPSKSLPKPFTSRNSVTSPSWVH